MELKIIEIDLVKLNGPFSQDCDDAFDEFLIFVFKKKICTFISLFFVLYYLCIKLQKKFMLM